MAIRRIAEILLFCLFFCAAVASGQQPPAQDLVQFRKENRSLVVDLALIRKKSRFLGWKYAARTGQEVPARRQQTAGDRIASEKSQHDFLSRAMASSATAAFANPGFATRMHLPTGYIPTGIVEGDFNGDGHLDIAICNGGENTIYVEMGNGDGTFQVPEVLYTQGQAPDWIEAVSLRNNEKLDLVVSDGDSNSVEVFLGNGDGTFQAGIQVQFQQTPTFVLAGDFNGDGKPDIVVGLTVDPGALQPQFEVLLGDGTGGFSGTVVPPPILGNPDAPTPTGWIASGDLNKDGFVDLVVTVTGGFTITYLNQHGTAFSQGNAFGPDDGPMVVGLGDMDGDGCLDAVELGTFGRVTIAKGTCDGNFTQDEFVGEAGDLEPAVKVVDVNGDGNLDVVASAAYYAAGGGGYGAEAGYLVTVLKGDGKGGLAPAQIYRGGPDAYSLVVADFTGDQRPEIITADSYENTASFYLNDGSGNYGGAQGEAITTPQGVANAPNPLVPMLTADLNGDGHPDLILIEDPLQFTAMLNDGTGKFLPPVYTPIALSPAAGVPGFITGAFRNPKTPDVIYIAMDEAPNYVAFFPGNGDGSFGTGTMLANLPNPENLVAGDFNGDGKLDFAVYGQNGNSLLELDVFLGHGDGTFTELPAQTFSYPAPEGGPQQMFAIDLNHDGKFDLLVGNNTNGGWTDSGDDLLEYLGNGDGTFRAPTVLISHFGAVAVADVNGDGLPDLIQGRDPTEDVGASIFGTPGVTIYLGQANGTFIRQPTYVLPGVSLPTVNPVLVGDFNGDGKPDIAVRYFQDEGVPDEARLRVLQGVGDGTFIVSGDVFQLPEYSNPFVGADFNGDGATDLVELVGYTSSFHTIPAAPGPALNIQLDSSPIIGPSGSATVTLDMPATSTQTVMLSASDLAVQLPATLTFSAGQQSQDFQFSLGSGFDATHALAIYAELGSTTAVAYGIRPNPNANAGISMQVGLGLQSSVGSISPGEDLGTSVTLTSTGGYTGTFAGFTCSGLPSGAACVFGTNEVFIGIGKAFGVGLTITTSSETPLGVYSVQVSATDGHINPSFTFSFGVGDFAVSISPATVVTGPSGASIPQITAGSINGLNEQLSVTCSGLPANVQCGLTGLLMIGGGTGLEVSGGPNSAADYPFQITAKANIAEHTIGAVLRVGDFTATLDKTAATLAPGQSATFNVTLKSINHYTSSISFACEPASSVVTCTTPTSATPLTDGQTVTIPINVTASSTSGALSTPTSLRIYPLSSIGGWAAVFLFTVVASIVRNRRMRVYVLGFLLLSMTVVSCGGGGSSQIVAPPPPPPPPPSNQVVNVGLFALAQTTFSDSNNQKTLGPLTITVQQ
jgi:hypothetical protein